MRARSLSDATIIIRIKKRNYQAPNIYHVTKYKGEEVSRAPVFVPEWNLDIWDKKSNKVYFVVFKSQTFYNVPGTAIGGAPEPKKEMLQWLELPIYQKNRLGTWYPERTFARWITNLLRAIF